MLERLNTLTISKPTALAMVLLLAVMPWFQGGRDPVGWMVLMGVAVLGSFILWRSPASDGDGRPSSHQNLGRLGLIWLVFVAWTALSMVWTVNRYQTFQTLLLFGFIGIIGVLAASLRDNPAVQWVFERSFLIIASLASVVGIYIFIAQTYERATSTFYLPNPFAGFLLPIIVIGLWRFAERGQLYEGLLAMLNLAVFILTDSRGASLALVVAVFVGLWLSQRMMRHWRRLLIVLFGALALSILVNIGREQVTHHAAFQGQRYQQLLSKDSSSSSDRVYYLKSALAIWADRPLAGAGAGTYATMHPRYQYRVISAGSNAHNYYVQVLAELGLVGFLLLFLALLELFLGVLRGLKQDPSKLPYALAVLALLVHAAVDIDSSYPVLWCLVVILAALVYRPARIKTKASVARRAMLASILLAVPAIWLFQNQAHAQNAADLQADAEYAKAAQYYELAQAHGPYDPDWIGAEGINHLTLAQGGTDKTKNLELAAAEASLAKRLDPQDGQHDFLLGRVLYAQNHLDQAVAAYRQAIAKDPYDHPEYYNDLASVLVQQQKLKAASDTLAVVMGLYTDAVIENRNYDPAIKTNVANSYGIASQVALAEGDVDKARSLLKQGLKIDKNSLIDNLLLQRIGE